MSSERVFPRSAMGSASLAEPVSFKPLSLRLNFAWTLAGNAVYGGAQWAMLILLAKLGNAEMVGRFALGLAVGAPVVMFTNMQLRLVQATDAREEYRFRDYLSLRLMANAVALPGDCRGGAGRALPAETLAVILLVGLAKCAESVSDVIWGLWQKARAARSDRDLDDDQRARLLARDVGAVDLDEELGGDDPGARRGVDHAAAELRRDVCQAAAARRRRRAVRREGERAGRRCDG